MPEKTTVDLKIFSTILLLTALSAANAGNFVTTGEAAPEVQQRLTETAHLLTRIFRSPWRHSRSDLTVTFSPAVPEYSAEVQFKSGEPFLMLNGSPDLRRNVVWRRKLYSAILLAAADARLRPGENAALPPWLIPALDMILEARRYEERLLVGNRRSPVLRALLEQGKLPPPETVRRADPADFDPAARFWAEELGRALFFAAGKKFASPGGLRECFAAESRGADPDKCWLPREPGKLERDFRTAARVLAWHELAPRPARWSLRRFADEQARAFRSVVVRFASIAHRKRVA